MLEIIKRIYKDKSNPLLGLLFVVVLFVIPFSFAFAVNFPPTFYYQAVLKNSSGTYLGSSSGTSYYFKFSIWDSATVGSGTRLWPSTTPGTTTLSVRSGVFSVNIGDTANSYPDALTYNFNSPTVVYLQTEVSSDNISSETISPRQQINQNPSSFGTSTPIGISVVSIAATTTNSVGLTIQGFLNQTANLFQVRSDSNTNLFSINNTGGLFAFVVDNFGHVGIATTSITSALTVNGDISASSYLLHPYGYLNASSTNNLSSTTLSTITDKIKNLTFTDNLNLINPPVEILSVSSSSTENSIDLYKLSTFNLAGLQGLGKEVEGVVGRIVKLKSLVSTSTPKNTTAFEKALGFLSEFGIDIGNDTASFDTLSTDQIDVQKLCLDDVCLTKTELEGLLKQANISASNSQSTTSNLYPSGQSTVTSSFDTIPPTITLIGANPAEISKGSPYIDLGVTVNDNVDTNLGFHSTGEVDVNTLGTYTIYYTATDQAGNTATTTRAVNIYDPYQSAVIDNVATSTESSP